MAYLEKEKCIHRDLAARNVLVGESLTCKIAGFELAEIVEDDVVKADSNFKFPIKWTACETFTSYPHESSTKSDVWSFGVLFWEIITCGCLPYPGMTNAQVQEEIVKGYRMPNPSGNPDQLCSNAGEKTWQNVLALRLFVINSKSFSLTRVLHILQMAEYMPLIAHLKSEKPSSMNALYIVRKETLQKSRTTKTVKYYL